MTGSIAGREQLLSEILGAARSATNRDELLGAVARTLRRKVPHYTWVGIYLVEGGDLVLGAWDGPGPTEHTRIRIGSGICGAAAAAGETIVVPDVAKDPRYIMCFANTRSEMVVPIKRGAEVIGEIDVDSDLVDAFTEDDKDLLEKVAMILLERLNRLRKP